jgi:hypothetical protein
MIQGEVLISSLNEILLNKSIEELEHALKETEKRLESDILLKACIVEHLQRKRFFQARNSKIQKVAV